MNNREDRNAAKRFSVVIAAYNEENAIGDVLSEIVKAYSEKAEIIVVNDGSTDSTEAVISRFPEVRLFNHRMNFGYGAALKTGIIESSTNIICFFDADGQHDVKDIGRLIESLEHSDMIIGVRASGSHKDYLRWAGKYLLKLMSDYITGQRIPDLNSGLRAVKRDVILKYIHILPDGFSATTTMTMTLLVRNYDVKFRPIITRKRIGKSEVRFIRDGFGAIISLCRIAMMFNPLRIFFPLSIFLIITGLVYGTYWMTLVAKQGFPVGALLITFIGLSTFIVGLLADQISAIRQERFEDTEAFGRYKKYKD